MSKPTCSSHFRAKTGWPVQAQTAHAPGFALIATISIMVLLVMIALAMLSLSTIELRSSQNGKAIAEAQANARMALMLAIGNLQKTMGRDQFVSAPAEILSPSSASTPKHYTGVWEGRRDPREQGSDDELGQTPNYDSTNSFVQWLVSNAEPTEVTNESFFLQGSALSDPVEVVGEGSAGPDGFVEAGRVPVTGIGDRDNGKFAWWVSENATKAMVPLDDGKMRAGQTRGDTLLAAGTPGPYGIEALDDLNIEANTEDTNRIVSMLSAELLTGLDGQQISSDKLREHFHDLTVLSTSLLTNVTRGGLRKDLSLFFEGNPESGQWLGSIKEGDAPTGPYGKDALSPHDEYDTGSWKQLRQHYAIHKDSKGGNSLLTGSVGETLKAVDDFNPPSGSAHPYPSWNSQRKLLTPVVARLSYVLSVGVQDASQGLVPAAKLNKITPRTKNYDPRGNKYMVTFHAYPVVSLWNPYSMNLECPGFSVGNMGMSVEHSVAIGSNKLDYQWIDHSYQGNSASWNVIGMTVDRGFTMEPGEVKMFFASDEVYRLGSQFYARGQTARNLRGIQFDASPSGGPFAAGIVKNGVIGNTFNQGNPNAPGDLLLYGLFANESDVVSIDTNIFTPQGSKNSGPRSDYNGLLYYGTYSSWDIRMVSRSFQNWQTNPLHWIKWGGGNQRNLASKWTNKIGWRNDEDNPVVLGEPIHSTVNIADLATGRKQPYMIVDLRLKATDYDQDQRNPNITWLHNIPFHGYSGCSGQSTPGVSVRNAGNITTESHARPYTVVYKPVQSANEAWNLLQLDSDDNELRPFFGNSYLPDGQHKAVATEIPMTPLQSIAQLQHVPQVPIDATRWSGLSLQNYAIGNSYPNPNLASQKISDDGWRVWLDSRVDNSDHRTNMDADLDGEKWHTTVNGQGPATEHFKPTKHLDRSYVANTLLWDDFYFSGLAAQQGDFYSRGVRGATRELDQVIEDFVNGTEDLPNSRFQPNLHTRSADDIISVLTGDDNYRKSAAYLDVIGGFNVNSTSKKAWKAFLASNLKKSLVKTSSRGRPSNGMAESTLDEYIISRYSFTPGEGHDISSQSKEKWLGYRILNEDDLDDLAEKIVTEVKERGPFRSIGEFVNRRLESGGGDKALRGALQAALDLSTVNEELASDTISRSEIDGTDYAFEEAALLSRHAGSPPYVLQGDLLQTIGSLIQVRSDTFTIRAYGESSDGKARAWCEAVVQRQTDWINSSDRPEEDIVDVLAVNQAFGRRLQVISFRWLTPSEV